MQNKANNPEDYIEQLPEERKKAFQKLRTIILKNLPEGFEETMSYGMIGYVVPHSIYPSGYHCDPKLPLPFISITSQKNFIALYHMGIYADPELLSWFQLEYKKHTPPKLDMGKSCIRFKNIDKIPYELIGELTTKISVEEWVRLYDSQVKNHRKKK